MADKQISEKDEFIKTIREFLNDNFLFGYDKELEEETSFLESGVIDSTGILELVCYLEEKYGILIADDEVVPENLDSLKNITNFLQTKKQDVNERKAQGTRDKVQGEEECAVSLV